MDISQTSFSEIRDQLPEIPTLKEVIDKYADKIHFFIEIKIETLKNFEEATQLKAIKKLKKNLSSLTPGENYHLMSLNTNLFKFIDFVPKEYQVSISLTNTKEIFKKTLKYDLGAMTGSYFLITDSQVKELLKEKKQVGLGFITSKNCLYKQINKGCYWIFTNHPKRINKYLNN